MTFKKVHINEGKGIWTPIIDFEDQYKLKEMMKESPNTDWYSSLFTFPKEIKEFFEKNGNSIQGYNGKATTSKLVFDFDSKVDLEIAKNDAISLLHEFEKHKIDIQK